MNAGADWSQGYVTDVAYTNSFFRELSPAWLNHVAVSSGAHPRPLEEAFTHLDLGCGLGQTSIVLAGCFPQGRFFGVDFNPAHIDTARHSAAKLGLDNVRFIERAFEELLEVELPEFDFITLHGIYSWINDDARRAVQRFIYARLKPGGSEYPHTLYKKAGLDMATPAPYQALMARMNRRMEQIDALEKK